MSRHAGSDQWLPGEYLIGRIDELDAEGRGIIGRSSTPIRVDGDVRPGDYVTAEIVSTDGEFVLAELAYAPTADLTPGDYLVGRINKLDAEARGILGRASSPIRIEGFEWAPGEYVTAQVTATDRDHVIAEPISPPAGAVPDVWIQQTEDTDAITRWHPRYSIRRFPFVFTSRLFARVEPSRVFTVEADESPWDVSPDEESHWVWRWTYPIFARIWAGIRGLLELLLGFAVLLFSAVIILRILNSTVVSLWFGVIGQSPVVLLLFLMAVALTYAGFAMFIYLIWLSGAILGAFLGIGTGGSLVAVLDLTGGTALWTVLLTMCIGAGLMGSLFVVLHRLAIMLNAFVSVALPTAYILSAGAIFSADLSLTSVWLVVPLLVAIVLGCIAAVLTWIVYRTTLVITTSFLGASFLVYIPVLAQSGVDFSAVGFPNVDFLIIFVSGIVVQAMIPEPEE